MTIKTKLSAKNLSPEGFAKSSQPSNSDRRPFSLWRAIKTIRLILYLLIPICICTSFLIITFESKKTGYIRINELEERINNLSYVLEREAKNANTSNER